MFYIEQNQIHLYLSWCSVTRRAPIIVVTTVIMNHIFQILPGFPFISCSSQSWLQFAGHHQMPSTPVWPSLRCLSALPLERIGCLCCFPLFNFVHPVICRVLGFPGGSDGKESAYNSGDLSLTPGSGRSPEDGIGNPLQDSCLENSMDRGA